MHTELESLVAEAAERVSVATPRPEELRYDNVGEHLLRLLERYIPALILPLDAAWTWEGLDGVDVWQWSCSKEALSLGGSVIFLADHLEAPFWIEIPLPPRSPRDLRLKLGTYEAGQLKRFARGRCRASIDLASLEERDWVVRL